MTPNLSDLYRQVLLDHSKHPRNFGRLEGGVSVALKNPMCGDEVTLFLEVVEGVVQQAAFLGHGCSIAMASASLLTEAVGGHTCADVLQIDRGFRDLVEGRDVADHDWLGELETLRGVHQFPARVACALLPWNALVQMMKRHEPPAGG